MTKKGWIFLLCAICLFGCACAGTIDMPALKNPEERYDAYFEQSDGSENMIYTMLDIINDEAATVEESGALLMENAYYLSGEVVLRHRMYLQMTDFGRVTVTVVEEDMEQRIVVTTPKWQYLAVDGVFEKVSPYEDLQFDWYWESFRFPYGNLQYLNGVRQDEAGNSYFLITSDENMSFEYAATSEMVIEELRIYARGASGELELFNVVKYSAAEAFGIPESLLSQMAEYEDPTVREEARTANPMHEKFRRAMAGDGAA